LNPIKPSWDERYRRGEGSERAVEPVVARAAHLMEPGVALDLACGLGRNAIHLAENGWQVVAVDSSRVALDGLGSLASNRGLQIQLVLANLEDASYSLGRDRYDLVCDCFFLHRPLFREIQECTRAGGLLAAALPVVDEHAPPMNPAYLIKPGELPREFPGWIVEHAIESRRTDRTRERIVGEYILRKPA
jgi:tellurite methyltransferase